ncbi:hypothetical protein K505DRAFT_368334 [Melanomma pulvis-pyrius CBS 109.77]|uniref:Uncharacterized protein n=1 Tax=Melanomma pulvis-pyrius CBS 109.77 TaxID=1314802 RepID=A0A6A6WQW1_9PLEO|nr:hypothetical protein K505DRAFT_368334 [Melanomma pulvis-pyrius CBS 109.77]
MVNKKRDAAKKQADNTNVMSTKRKRVVDSSPDPVPTPKQRRTERLNERQWSWACHAYGKYMMNNKSPLDFITFLDALPEEIWNRSWTHNEFASYALPHVRAAEEEINLDIGRLSTAEKCFEIKQAIECINDVLLDAEHASPEQASGLTPVIDYLYLSTRTSVGHSAARLGQHTSTMKDKLATAQSLQDTLETSEKMLVEQLINNLKEKVERAEKLGKLFGRNVVE